MKIEEAQHVKYFIGALYSDLDLLAKAKQLFEQDLGMIDDESDAFAFDITTYYDAEMGSPISRQFFSFNSLRSPGELAELKVQCNLIEDQLQVNGLRKVNLDIGYLDLHKLVLASAKYDGQKIYLGHGIYADPTLVFTRGEFQALEHTFPDFKSDQYYGILRQFREQLKVQLKSES